MSRKSKNALGLFTESIGLYFSNFDKFVKYMTFPVLGQIIGMSLAFLLTYFYAKQIPTVIEKFPVINSIPILLGILVLLILPGLAIFTKAFWEYLVAYGALNSMFENMSKSGKVYDFDAHTELIKRRAIPFIGLWFLFGIFSFLALCPLFWVICGVFAIYFVLIFQVFTFEPELSPIECAKKSFLLIKGHFVQTFMLISIVGALTYILIPQLANMFFEYIKLNQLISSGITPLISELPIGELNNILSYVYLKPLEYNQIATFTTSVFVSQIFIQYTLPLRSILWSMWYKELNGSIPKTIEKKKNKTLKPSEKLMKESHKKFASKKLDKNILKRAMEKEED